MEELILDHLRNEEENESDDDDDEKEAENLLNIYKKCHKLSQKTSSKLSKIDKKFKKLVLKMEKNLYPDEKKWKEWNGKEFRRFVFFWGFLKFLLMGLNKSHFSDGLQIWT